MKFLIVERSIKRPVKILYDILVRVDMLIFLAGLVVLDYDMDINVLIILG